MMIPSNSVQVKGRGFGVTYFTSKLIQGGQSGNYASRQRRLSKYKAKGRAKILRNDDGQLEPAWPQHPHPGTVILRKGVEWPHNNV